MTSPSLLADLPDLIAAKIRIVLPQLATCKGLVGRADVEQLKRIGVASPAVLISRVRTVQDRSYAGPHVTYTVEMAAFVICKDGLGATRHEMAGRIAQVLLALVPNSDWGLPDDLGLAETVQELPLASMAADEAGLAVIAVTWTQNIALSGIPQDSALDPQVYMGLLPQIGAAHEADYDLVGGAP